MNLDAVIQQLRVACPAFAGRVAGAANFAAGIATQAWLETPAAYVVPLEEDAADNTDYGGLQQLVTERIAVIVHYDNAADRRGQGPSSGLDAMRTQVFRAILNWRPDPQRSPRGIAYAGGSVLESEQFRARLFYQLEFVQTVLITEADGWQPAEMPLLEIDVTRTDASTGAELSGIRVPLPQF